MIFLVAESLQRVSYSINIGCTLHSLLFHIDLTVSFLCCLILSYIVFSIDWHYRMLGIRSDWRQDESKWCVAIKDQRIKTTTKDDNRRKNNYGFTCEETKTIQIDIHNNSVIHTTFLCSSLLERGFPFLISFHESIRQQQPNGLSIISSLSQESNDFHSTTKTKIGKESLDQQELDKKAGTTKSKRINRFVQKEQIVLKARPFPCMSSFYQFVSAFCFVSTTLPVFLPIMISVCITCFLMYILSIEGNK